MPKIIADLETTLRKEARRMILEEGYEAFNMRAVAANCKVAVGTVYNYFTSKEMLAASVMLEDWLLALEAMANEAQAAQDVMHGLRNIFSQILRFCSVYQRTWQAYADGGKAVSLRGEYHEKLILQLGEVIAPLLARFGCDYAPVLPAFLAENLLNAAARGEARFDELVPVLRRLV